MSTDPKVYLFVVSALVFVATELVAVFNRRRGDTASERVWRMPLPIRVVIGGVALGLGVWLFGHFIWEIWG